MSAIYLAIHLLLSWKYILHSCKNGAIFSKLYTHTYLVGIRESLSLWCSVFKVVGTWKLCVFYVFSTKWMVEFRIRFNGIMQPQKWCKRTNLLFAFIFATLFLYLIYHLPLLMLSAQVFFGLPEAFYHKVLFLI